MTKDLDAFPCPSCGETLYAHLVGIAANGDFSCPSCGESSNVKDVKDPAAEREKGRRGKRGRGSEEEE